MTISFTEQIKERFNERIINLALEGRAHGDHSGAVQLLQSVLNENPTHPRASLELARMVIQLGHIEQANRILDVAESPATLTIRAERLLLANQLDLSVALYSALAQKFPKDRAIKVSLQCAAFLQLVHTGWPMKTLQPAPPSFPNSNIEPVFSVILTCYNAENTVEAAVRSILYQTFKDFELIIIDDRSTDGSPAILHRLASSDQRIRIFRIQSNAGTYVARNHGLRLARGKYITFHDADDLYHPKKLATQYDAFLAGADAVTCQVINVTSALQLKSYPSLCFVGLALTRDTFNRIGFFDMVRYGADEEYMRRCRAIVTSFCDLNDLLYLYIHHDRSLTHIRPAQSPDRIHYMRSAMNWHRNLYAGNCRLEFPSEPAFPRAARMQSVYRDLESCTPSHPTLSVIFFSYNRTGYLNFVINNFLARCSYPRERMELICGDRCENVGI